MSREQLIEVPLGKGQPIAKCRGCGAMIFWVLTPRGKKMPLRNIIGVRNRPGAIVQTRTPRLARSRAIGSVMPTTPPFDAE